MATARTAAAIATMAIASTILPSPVEVPATDWLSAPPRSFPRRENLAHGRTDPISAIRPPAPIRIAPVGVTRAFACCICLPLSDFVRTLAGPIVTAGKSRFKPDAALPGPRERAARGAGVDRDAHRFPAQESLELIQQRGRRVDRTFGVQAQARDGLAVDQPHHD